MWMRGWKQHASSYLPLTIHYGSFLLLFFESLLWTESSSQCHTLLMCFHSISACSQAMWWQAAGCWRQSKEMDRQLVVCVAVMVVVDNRIAYPRCLESCIQPQLGLCHWDVWDRHQLSWCPSDISLVLTVQSCRKNKWASNWNIIEEKNQDWVVAWQSNLC